MIKATEYVPAAEAIVGKSASSSRLFGQMALLAIANGDDRLAYRFALQAQRAARVELGLPKHGALNLR